MGASDDNSSWGRVLRRAAAALLPRRAADRRRGWSLLVPVVLLFAGMLFTTTATTANGTDLRNDRRPELANLISERKRDVAAAEAQAGDLRRHIESQTAAQAGSDAPVAEQRSRGQAQSGPAGLVAVHGPGLTVRLNDAPRRPDGSRPAGSPDDLVVHQQDVQAVVNALWSGGGEAMSIMGVRVISTSAVRCVGNTLLLDGRVYSPPFVVTAIGDPVLLQRALDASPGVRAFRSAATDFGLGYEVKVEGDVTVPAYEGSVALRSAQPPS
ncbi:DUF881 domain-containing protein [Planosporangium mesophilum]|uniref:Membrane protein n=1 Tax=Planosporangium mesophilum TaxID=689768 RepID=A0A8J3X2T0_9ACTN|nr:DUF881 domain-containing protein [Planosporangium mesophilum]NJC82155.1 DUF881 domain-containing protein [Planosporangium mesophilum]GII22203.1 membrane protein [Planosporangium mesophilum]